jgi:SAM-dependent methyltransferase
MSDNIGRQMSERSEYLPCCPQETFIVPLVKEKVEMALVKYAACAPKGGFALDVGCGGQPFRNLLETYGYVYKGMDVSQNPKRNVDFVCQIDEPLPDELIKHEPFQFVICTEVIEHVAGLDMAFRNLRSLVAPKGKILITCPHFYQLHSEPHDFWRFTPHAMRYFAERYNFEVVDQEVAGDAWDVIGTALANCSPAPLSDRLEDRVKSRLVSITRRLLFGLLSRRRLQRMAKMMGPLYLSNIVILARKE